MTSSAICNRIETSSSRRTVPAVTLFKQAEKKYKSAIDELKQEWTQLASSLSQFKDKGWKEFIEHVDENRSLTDFRKKLDTLLKRVCSLQLKNPCVSECKSSGSTELTSDIDITLQGNCLATNLFHLEALRKLITVIFSQGDFFKNDRGVFEINRVFHLFDINFYISNFAINKLPNYNKNKLSSYWLSTSIKQIKVIRE